MKSTIHFHKEYNNYCLHPQPDRKPVEAFFIHTQCLGDFNLSSYDPKKKFSTGKESRTQIYFIPRPDAKESDIQCELKRGKQFFTKKDGFLFGALYELTKLGEIIKIAV